MSTIEEVFAYLKREGMEPEMESFGIKFTYQMSQFEVIKDEEDNSFLQIALPGIYEVTDENRLAVLVASNKCNVEKKVIKTVVNADRVWGLYEVIVDPTSHLDEVIPRGINMLLCGRDAFYRNINNG